jgi:hypothetical protein
MAEPVALGIKPPQPMSLGDMLNIARGAQQYQQAEEMNPLLLKQQQQEIAGKAQEVETGGIKLTQTRQADQERLALQDLMQNRSESIMTNGMFDPAKLNAIVPKIAPYTGQKFIQDHVTLGKAQNEMMESSSRLNQNDLATIAGPLGVMGRAGVQDPQAYIKELDILKEQHKNNPNAVRLIESQQTILKQFKPGEAVAQGAVRAAEKLMTPQEQIAYTKPGLTTNAAGELVAANPVTGVMKPLTGGGNVNPSTTDVNLGAKYQENLSNRVASSNAYLQRAEEIESMMGMFKPGAGTSTYAQVAERLQALGAPQALVDRVAGGDLSAVQSMNKFMAQSVIASARQAANGSTYASEMENFLKNNPTVETDPRALQRFIDFNKKLARTDLLENEALAQAKEKGIYNPGTWQADWQKIAQSKGLLPKTPSAQNKEQSKEQPTTQQYKEGQTGMYNGRKVIFKNGAWAYQ